MMYLGQGLTYYWQPRKKKIKYVIKDRRVRHIINGFATLAEAEAAIAKYEADFYEIAEI
jgi:hypothetical protein